MDCGASRYMRPPVLDSAEGFYIPPYYPHWRKNKVEPYRKYPGKSSRYGPKRAERRASVWGATNWRIRISARRMLGSYASAAPNTGNPRCPYPPVRSGIRQRTPRAGRAKPALLHLGKGFVSPCAHPEFIARISKRDAASAKGRVGGPDFATESPDRNNPSCEKVLIAPNP